MANGRDAVIAGIGQTEFSKNSGRSELQLACEAIKTALDDAGLTPADVDGMTTYTLDNTEDVDLVRSLGVKNVRFSSRVGHGGGGSVGTLAHALAAVKSGLADVVVGWRAMNERSEPEWRQAGFGDRVDELRRRSEDLQPLSLCEIEQHVAVGVERRSIVQKQCRF